MMKTKTVLLCGQDDILSHSVDLFLSSRKDWKVIRISSHCALKQLLKKIKNVNPDVVILHQGSHADSTNLPSHLMKDHAGLKVITISSENNSMEIYNKEQVWLKTADDLLSIIEDTNMEVNATKTNA